MSSTQASLDAQANDRKARLAKLRSLKRKQPPTEGATTDDAPAADEPQSPETPDVTAQYLSGRNYDIAARGPKLGFENTPTANQSTLEEQAASIATETAQRQAEEDKADKPIDLFKLQPKKPNWDLKRDLGRKLEVLNVRTDNAIAKLVRQRVQQQQEKAQLARGVAMTGDAEEQQVGIDGTALVEGVHLREREEQEDGKRETEDDDLA
ncbi:MAG: hypothetical protein M1826_001505 [Phylliscum demangeonii]|nr:MAG: hypothetical protein M1826_001505 [Phylliscum demangeonii]